MTPSDISIIKHNLRTAALEKRRAFVKQTAPKALADLQQGIVELALKHVEFPKHSIIAGYWPMTAEIDIRPLMGTLIKQGHTLCLPVTQSGTQPLVFRQWQPGMLLEKGSFGVMVPPHDSPLCVPEIVFVPLVAWDKQGHRLGYGQGHYDRTLAALRHQKKITAIGFGYERQYSDALPVGPLDEPLDSIITERRALKRDHETSLLR